MPSNEASYFTAYRSLKFTRDSEGVLVLEFHNDGRPFIMTAKAHTDFVDAFYQIAQDRANKIVILKAQVASSLVMSIGLLLAMWPIPAFGAKFTTKGFRLWKT